MPDHLTFCMDLHKYKASKPNLLLFTYFDHFGRHNILNQFKIRAMQTFSFLRDLGKSNGGQEEG